MFWHDYTELFHVTWFTVGQAGYWLFHRSCFPFSGILLNSCWNQTSAWPMQHPRYDSCRTLDLGQHHLNVCKSSTCSLFLVSSQTFVFTPLILNSNIWWRGRGGSNAIQDPRTLVWERFHHLWALYSSNTTGPAATKLQVSRLSSVVKEKHVCQHNCRR